MAEEIEREPCPRCRKPAPLTARACPHCKGSLLVDVVHTASPAQGRIRYQIARAVSALGPPVPPFAAVQAALAIPRSVLVSGVTRDFAQRVVEALEEHGGRGRTTAAVEDVRVPDEQAPGSRLSTVVVIAVLLGLLGFGLYTWSRRLGNDDEIDIPTRAGQTAAQGPVLNASAVAARLAPATVALRCRSSLASGFFVARDLVLTKARVGCPPGESLRAVLADGKETVATLEQQDDWLNLALVRIPEANAEPLPLGDATALRTGDRVVFAGAPGGEEPVREGMVSRRARNIFGLAFLQIDGVARPGTGGGPLVDRHGRVVGVAVAKLQPGEGMVYMLPINYVYSGTARLLPPPVQPAPDDQSWRRLLSEVAAADRKDVERVQSGGGRPALLGLSSPSGQGLVAVVARRAHAEPRPEKLTFAFRSSDRLLCTVTAVPDNWRRADDRPDAAAAGPGADSRYMQWMKKHNLDSEVFLGSAPLDLQGCPLEELRGAQVVLEGADERADRVGV